MGDLPDIRSPVFVKDDELGTEEAHPWTSRKYGHFRLYATLFTQAMSGKWRLVYVDLFASSGYSQKKGSRQIMEASPLLALRLQPGFNVHIFCEQDPRKITHLEQRVRREHPEADAHFVSGDCNERIRDVICRIPAYSGGRASLTFCYSDPYKLRDLDFSTIRTLSEDRRVDFLILIPSFMEGNRNLEKDYCKPGDRTVERFFGVSKNWRHQWTREKSEKSADLFLTDLFGRSMEGLGHIYAGAEYTEVIRNTKRVPLYRLAFFSKHPLAIQLWQQARKYGKTQTEFEFSEDH